MSQERTEQFIQQMKKEAGNYGETLLLIGAQQLEEIDRLNATIAGQAEAIREQTAKVQERDKRMNELAADAYAASEACQSMSEEIERLRSQMALVLSIAERAAEDFAQGEVRSIGLNLVNIKTNLRESLKGAE